MADNKTRSSHIRIMRRHRRRSCKRGAFFLDSPGEASHFGRNQQGSRRAHATLR